MTGRARKALVAQATLIVIAAVAASSALGVLQYNYAGTIDNAASADAVGYQFFGVAADSQGRVYASDWTVTPPATLRAQVRVFSGISSPGGSQLLGSFGQYGAGGAGAGFLAMPMAIAVDASGRLFVADYGGVETIEVFNPFDAGAAASFQFGTPAELTGAIGLSFDSRNRLYVPEYAGQSVSVYDNLSAPPGAPIAVVNTSVAGDSFASIPFAAAADSTGTLYVSDLINMKIKIFVPLDANWTNYQYTGSLTIPAGDVSVAVPVGLAVDSADRLHVLDINNSKLHMFSSRSSGIDLIASTGSPGSGPGQFQSGISIATAGGLVYVGDLGNSRIQAFSLGESTDPGGGAPTKEASAMTLRIDKVISKKPKKKSKKGKKSASATVASKKNSKKPSKKKKKKRNTSVAKVGFRGQAKLSGRLTHKDGQALANTTVSVYARSYRPGTSDHKIKDLTTKSDGSFSYKYKGSESKKMTVKFAADSTHEAVNKKVSYLMKDSVTLKAKKVGEKRFRLSGKVQSARYQYRNRYTPYKLVEISFRKSGGSDARIYQVLRANRRTGRFKTLVTPRYEGKQLFRARAIGGYAGAYRDGRSRSVTVWPSR